MGSSSTDDELRLDGLDGSNPLGFLALLGTLCVASSFAPRVQVRWCAGGAGWRPVLCGHGLARAELAVRLANAVGGADQAPFDLSARLPFAQADLRRAMGQAATDRSSRRGADLLAGFGSDAFVDDGGDFLDTALRMVRSGDSAGQGLPHYVATLRRGLSAASIEATLFEPWRYDDDTFSLRWDPIEDQRYALRADNPADKANKRVGSKGVRAANALAAEAMALIPVQPQSRGVATTGFTRSERRSMAWTWPIWDRPCSLDVVRSLLSLPGLSKLEPDAASLRALGIAQVFRSERFESSKYYKNFSPARPV